MGLLAIGLLVVGGSAVAMAADPTASPTPAETTRPADIETTVPATDGTDSETTAPATGGMDTTGHRGRGDCPAKGDGGTAPGGGSGTTPDDPTTPEPSIDASDV